MAAAEGRGCGGKQQKLRRVAVEEGASIFGNFGNDNKVYDS